MNPVRRFAIARAASRVPSRLAAPHPKRQAAADQAALAYRLALGYVVVLGLLVRLSFVLPFDFPINDGGLFFAMAGDVARSDFHLPWVTSYNGGEIPFAYPPLALYLAALLNVATSLPLVDALRFVPLVASTLTIVAFLRLARTMLVAPVAVVAAGFAFALNSDGFYWVLMGGGLTRSLGFLFATLATEQVYRLYHDGDRTRLLSVTLCAAGAVLSHPEWAWYTACVGAYLFVALGRNWRGLWLSAGVCAGVAVLTAPWWATVLARHGLDPIRATLSANGSEWPPYLGLLVLLGLRWTDEPVFPMITALALLGLIACLRSRRWLLPGWLLTVFALQPLATAQKATTVVALLAGVGVAEVLLPLLRGALFPPPAGAPAAPAEAATDRGVAADPLVRPVLAAVLLYVLASAAIGGRGGLGALSADDRSALAWVAEQTPPDARFVVVSGASWGVDHVSEWLPALTGRVSESTPQGYEWTTSGAFAGRVARHRALQRCASEGADCLEAAIARYAPAANYVYVVRQPSAAVQAGPGCCKTLAEALAADPRYRLVYTGEGASLFERINLDRTAPGR